MVLALTTDGLGPTMSTKAASAGRTRNLAARRGTLSDRSTPWTISTMNPTCSPDTART